MVSLLKEISQQALEQSLERPTSDSQQQPLDSQTVENLKFIRGERMTTKMQREVYQGKVNEIFRRQLAYHLEEKTEEVTELESEPADDFTARDEDDFEEESTMDYQALDQSSWCVFQDNQYQSIQNLKELPGYEKLLLHKVAPELATDAPATVAKVHQFLDSKEIDMRCRALRRTIRSLEDGSVKVVYCSDEKLIAKFLKRKRSKKATAAQKSRQHQAQVMSLTEISRLQQDSSITVNP